MTTDIITKVGTSIKTNYSNLAIISITASVIIGVVTLVLVGIDIFKKPSA